MKTKFIFIIMIMLSGITLGQQVSKDEAKIFASEICSWTRFDDSVMITDVYECTKYGHKLMFEVHTSDGRAILLSGNYKCKPILATINYAERSLLNNRDSLPGGLAFMLDWYEEQIERAFNDSDNSATLQDWRGHFSPSSRITGVGPLTTSKWGQGPPYNRQIPTPLLGNCDHALVGCVAVAIGQLMYYYKHPLLMTEQVKQFDWCNMKDILTNYSTENEIDAVATLLADCAEMVNSIYGCNSTTSLLTYGRDALRDVFKYNSHMSFEYQDNHSDQWWKSEIISQLDRGNPVPYAGATNVFGNNGHAFVCDGYNEHELFHFNWGWEGRYDGVYCEITHIYNNDYNNPYNSWLCAIFYAYPENQGDLCNGTLFLEDFYTSFYHIPSNGSISPYDAVPSTVATLVSVGPTYDSAWRTIPAPAATRYLSHKNIVLRDGFTVEEGADFMAKIIPCPNCENNGDNLAIVDIEEATVETTMAHHLNVHGTNIQSAYVYPNPTDGELTMAISGGVESVVILDINGNPQGGWDLETLTDSQIVLNVRRLKTGVYILVVRHPGGCMESARFVKQ